jgi:integrase
VRAIPRSKRLGRSEPRRRILSQDEEARLLAYMGSQPWLREIVTVALNQGLRLGEVLGLQVDDVDFSSNKLRVRHSLDRDGTLGATKHAKLTGKRDPRDEHPIDLLPAAREILLEKRLEVGEGFLFRNTLGGQRERRDVQRGFSQAVKRAGLSSDDGAVSFHTLRHTCASRLANNPAVGVTYARDHLGHTSLQITNGYVHRVENQAVTTAAAQALSG